MSSNTHDNGPLLFTEEFKGKVGILGTYAVNQVFNLSSKLWVKIRFEVSRTLERGPLK